MTRYELLDRIGVGGMAEIFRGKAVAAGGFEKPVAIKRILPHLSQDKRFVELLIAEAKVLSLLKHRNIVQIFDVGLGDDAQYFLVMEYVDGKDLGAIQRGLEAKRRKMAFDLALHLIAEICEALEHAHTARAPDGRSMALVHRDVSPSNVLLSRAGEVKLTDFGIAKRAESEATGHGTVRGKFAYISPEQARNEQVGPKSDVFSVGILLWELICNRPLFSNLGDLEALRAVREPTPIQRPSEVDPRVHPEIDEIVMKALQRERDKRPTAGQLGQMLRGLRYSLESTVGDPATELARVIDNADAVERESAQLMTPPPPKPAGGSFDSMEPGEMTVIRIRTADAFSKQNNDSLSMARQTIERFEEEETRLAQLSGDQLRMLRQGNPTRDSGEMPTVTPPRPRRSTNDEATRMRPPLAEEDEETIAPDGPNAAAFQRRLREKDYEMARSQYDQEDATRLVAPRDRRTPPPQRIGQPPPMPGLPPPVPQTIPAPSAPMPAPMPPPMLAPPVSPPQLPPPHRPPAQPQVIPATMMMPPAMVPPREPAVAMPGFPPPETAQPMIYMQPQAPQPMPYHAGWTPQPQPLPPPQPAAPAPTGSPIKPWMLIVGAVLMALIAFAITRKFMT